MRIPSIPGPRDVLTLVDRGADAIEQLLAAVPRMTALLAAAEALVRDAADLIARIEETRAEAEKIVLRTDETRRQAEALIEDADNHVLRLVALLDILQPSLTRLQPTLERLAETTDPREVDALVALVDHLPLLAEKMETDVVPVLDSLSSVAPDLHDLLDVSRELNDMLAKLPGMGRIKRRVDEEQEVEGRG